MKYLFLFFIIIFTFLNSNGQVGEYSSIGGTTVITIITKDSIWIAADSKRSNRRNEPKNPFCKIAHQGNIFYTVSGPLVWMINPKNDTIFDCYGLLKRTLLQTQNVDTCFIKFNNVAIPLLNKTLASIKKDEGQTAFNKLDSLVFSITLTGFVNGNIQYKSWYYTIENKQGITHVKTTVDDYPKAPFFVHLSGSTKSIEDKLTSQPNYFKTKKFKTILLDLISLEIKSNPEKVGLPINIIVLYKDGYKWLTSNNVCN